MAIDANALRKLAITLKPLIEIADALEKAQVYSEHEDTLKGKIVALGRERDALVRALDSDKAEADSKIAAMLSKAKEQAEEILEHARKEASVIVQKVTESETKRLTELRMIINKAEAESKEWDSRIKKLMTSANAAEARLKEAEKSLEDIRAAYAAARI